MIDENLVEATQALRALEDGDEEDYYPIEPSAPSPEPEDSRPAKRSKSDQNGSGGMLGGDAMDNIKFYADLARKQAEEERKRKMPAKADITGLLGGYDSD
jgi:hypothetical protein